MDLEYDELARMIDLKIAASLERIWGYSEDDPFVSLSDRIDEEIEWLRAP